jgi:hypothetical protein
MMTQPTDLPIPPGGQPDLWVGAQRDVYSQIGYVAVSPDLLSCPAVTVVGEQYSDGRIGCVDVILDVEMGGSHSGLSSAQARELAGLLTAAADLADTWAGRAPSAADRLAALRDQLSAVWQELRTTQGNVGDYLLGSLYSLADAIEVAPR